MAPSMLPPSGVGKRGNRGPFFRGLTVIPDLATALFKSILWIALRVIKVSEFWDLSLFKPDRD